MTATPETPGPVGGLTDVAGLRVGHATRREPGWLTGVTVVLPPPGTLGAVDVRGTAPATHETTALEVGTAAPFPHAVVVTGGSAYGLAATAGVARWLEEHGIGHPVGHGLVVPVVPAAAVYDLGRGGDLAARPGPEDGYAAAAAAWAAGDHAPVGRGAVGAGTGATLADESFKGGVGTASTRLTWDGGEAVVAALVVLNAYGTVRTGPAPHAASVPWARARGGRHGVPAPALNTSVVVLATDLDLDHGSLARTAAAGHDGLARVLDPVHTLADGDTVVALATRARPLPSALAPDRPGTGLTRRDEILAVQATAARVVEAAVLDAVRSAEHVRTPAVDLAPFPLPPHLA